VSFDDSSSAWFGGWYNASGIVGDQAAATSVVVGSTDVEVNTSLKTKRPQLMGRVTDNKGAGVGNICVTTNGWSTDCKATTWADGRYSIDIGYFLYPGTVHVYFLDRSLGHESGWYGVGGLTKYEVAASDVVIGSSDVLNISAVLPEYQHISGTITTKDGQPVPSYGVSLYQAGFAVSTVYPDDLGVYSFNAFPGTYVVQVGGTGDLAFGWYSTSGFVNESGAASPIVVTDHGVTANLVVPWATYITGIVRSTPTHVLQGIEVDLYRAGVAYGYTQTAADGTFKIPVTPGTYQVGYYDNGGTWSMGWLGASGYTADSSAALKLNGGATSFDVGSVTLPPVRWIMGKITATRAPQYAVIVEAFVGTSYIGYVEERADGTYSIRVPAGDVTLWFYDRSANCAGGWYTPTGPAANWRSATKINAPGTVTGKNITLPTAQHIYGAIRGTDGAFANDVLVESYVGGSSNSLAWSDGSGSYMLPVLPGTYTLSFDGTAYNHYSPGWYIASGSHFTNDRSLASSITVTWSIVANVTIPPVTYIGGRVASGNDVAIGNIDVELLLNGSYYADALTDADGTYSIATAPGTYLELFGDPFDTYATAWYSSGGPVSWRGDATPLTTVASDLLGTDIELPLMSAPGKPRSVHADPYNQSASVTWDHPVFDGGFGVTGYTVTASDGTHTCTTTGALACTVTGLNNGDSYTFTVTATNSLGTSDPSDPSAAVVPLAVPDAPVVTAIGFDSVINVSWTVPADNGSDIVGYTATANPGGKTCTTTTELACQIGSLANKTAYTISVVATNGNGPGAPGYAATTVTPRVGATYFGLTPSRVLDTRSNTGITGKIQSHVAASFQVTGLASGDPTRNVPADATAVTGFVSVSGSVAAGWLSVTPEPINNPTTSTLNFPKGDKRTTGVTVPLGSGGKLSVTYGAIIGPTILTDVIFDVTGYFVTNTSGSTYTALTPNRLVDSRAGATNTGITNGALVSGIAKTFTAVNRAPGDATKNVPIGAVAITGTLTVTGQTSAGYLSLGPDALNAPPTTSLFFAANPAGARVLDNRATGVTVKLSPTGTLGINFTGGSASAKADVIFDVTGFFMPGSSGATYVPISPNRILDSRPTSAGSTNAGYLGKIKQRVPITFNVVNRTPSAPTTNVPSGAVAVTGVLTVTTQTAAGYLSLTNYPVANPTTSTLNFPFGDNRATGVTVPLSNTGTLSVTYAAAAGATTNVLFDVSGYFVN
jgi:hypothetical protein